MAGTAASTAAEENLNKKFKSDVVQSQDRLTTLPDSLIHRILRLLPATDIVKTCVLSKRWISHWTHVPVLEFTPIKGISPDHFSNFIDKTLTLHHCSNIDKFAISIRFSAHEFPNLASWIRFAVQKHVKELVLELVEGSFRYLLPRFIFNCSSFVKLSLSSCDFESTRKVHWECVKSLRLDDCIVGNREIQEVLSGSPLLQKLELSGCDTLEAQLVIASESLKSVVVDGFDYSSKVVEISCPNVERLRLSGLSCFTSLSLVDLPSSVDATLDFHYDIDTGEYMSHDDRLNLVQQTLRQVQHVEKLEIGRWMMEILSSSKEDRECIGGLPDSFIHRIISFSPSRKDITDGYKSWRNKWTDVAILNFVSNEKLCIDSKDIPLLYLDPKLSLWIWLAARKGVKELILDCNGANVESGLEYPLPQYLFNNSSLVKMELCACEFMPTEKVNWESLKSLELDHCLLSNQAIENVLSGSPLLEYLELIYCIFEGAVVIASKHLKTLILMESYKNCHLLEISCHNLESLKIWRYLGSTSLQLMDLPASLHASLKFYISESDDFSPDDCVNLVNENVKPILHVEELEIELSRMRS